MPTNPPSVRFHRACGCRYVNSGVRAVTQVILAALRIDPADIERSKRIAGNGNTRDAFGLGGGWGPKAVQGPAIAPVAVSDMAAPSKAGDAPER